MGNINGICLAVGGFNLVRTDGVSYDGGITSYILNCIKHKLIPIVKKQHVFVYI